MPKETYLAPLPHSIIEDAVNRALAEDLAWGDITTDNLISPSLQGRATFLAKQSGVVAGLDVAACAFANVHRSVVFEPLVKDGARTEPKQAIARVEGRVTSILKAERTALNFLQRLSGIATLTSRFVEAVGDAKGRIIDTRKTTPGLRLLEKYAIRAGGGSNHRFHLGDGILIKDNHLAALERAGEDLGRTIARMRHLAPHYLKVEVEVTSAAQAVAALEAGADILLLDNMAPRDMKEVVRMVAGRALTEASGGITLETVREVALTGVDLISVGALTHSYKALDISLEM